jgi:hypothetical protein
VSGAVNPLNAPSLAEALPHLRRPFSPAAVKYKIQTNPKADDKPALIVAFIDARLASERLNYVCPGEWGTRFESVEGGVLCHLTVFGETRCDVGWSKGRTTDIDLKSVYSDAFKRAAVHFGVGVSLYALPQMRLRAPEIKKFGQSWYIERKGEDVLRGQYIAFLNGKGSQFGEPLDHGDDWDSQGGEEVAAVREETAPEAPAPATREKEQAPRRIKPEAVGPIIARFTKSGKTVDELRMWGVAKSVELDLSSDMETTFGALTVDEAKALVDWLKGGK